MSEPRFNPHLAATMPPPVMEARRWLEGVEFPPERPLINLSQAAPVDPPPAPLVAAMAQALSDPASHLYGPVLGLPELRAELAAQWSAGYHGQITPSQVAITSGCNQAFVAACATLAGPGDEVLLPCPYYFNHKMWLDMAGVGVGLIPTDASLLPDPEAAAARIGPRTRASALVSPNNPCGVEYPRELLAKFFELCQARGIALILDETYRDFDARPGAPHALFQDPDWPKTLIHLYSFSKAFRLTGHRVGAIIADQAMLMEVEKFLDTVAICPNQLGQIAALWGLQNMAQWCAGERAEILDRPGIGRAGRDPALDGAAFFGVAQAQIGRQQIKQPVGRKAHGRTSRLLAAMSISSSSAGSGMPRWPGRATAAGRRGSSATGSPAR